MRRPLPSKIFILLFRLTCFWLNVIASDRACYTCSTCWPLTITLLVDQYPNVYLSRWLRPLFCVSDKLRMQVPVAFSSVATLLAVPCLVFRFQVTAEESGDSYLVLTASNRLHEVVVRELDTKTWDERHNEISVSERLHAWQISEELITCHSSHCSKLAMVIYILLCL